MGEGRYICLREGAGCLKGHDVHYCTTQEYAEVHTSNNGAVLMFAVQEFLTFSSLHPFTELFQSTDDIG